MTGKRQSQTGGLGAFCERLGEIGRRYDFAELADGKNVKRRVGEWGGINEQYFAPSKLGWITRDEAEKLSRKLKDLIPELGDKKLDFGDYDKSRDDRSLDSRWQQLTAFLRAIEAALQAQAASTRTLDDPAWRRIRRHNLESVINEKLGKSGFVAVIGMSGMGKTWLANRVFEEDKEREKHRLDAPKPDDQGYLGGHAFDAFVSKLFWIVRRFCVNAELPKVGTPRRVLFDDHLANLKDRIVRLRRKEPEIQIDPVKERPIAQAKSFMDTLASDAVPNDSKARAYALAILCVLAERPREFKPKALILIDDVWPDAPNAEIATLILNSLSPDGVSNQETHERPWRLLLTAQDRRVASSFKGEPPSDRIVELDAAEEDRIGFGQRVVAAWAAPTATYASQEEADQAIAAFHDATFTTHAPAQAEIGKVIKQLDGHPFALAALASRWLKSDYETDFWGSAAENIKDGEEDRDWTQSDMLKEAGNRGLANPRHEDVLQALRFAIGRVENVDQHRLSDLLVQRRGTGAVRKDVFTYWWKRPGGDTNRKATGTDTTFKELTRLSLLQREGEASNPTLRLHDLMRLALQNNTQTAHSDLAPRHRDLLEAAGLLKDEQLVLDEKEDFKWEWLEGEDEKRCKLHLRLLPPQGGNKATEKERDAVSSYMHDELMHHLSSLGEPLGARLRQALLTRFSFLQAQLDVRD